jgi:ribosomal protein S18 acetylase RimI-like enzyme
LLEYLSQKEYDQINALQGLCHAIDQTNLKLELDYKLHVGTTSKNESNSINEFLYYVGETLVAYIGISCFGGNIGEINGMTHPDWRRKGLFQRLFVLAANECRKRSYLKILLLSDGKSISGIDFIQSIGGNYEASEYRMKLGSFIKAEASDSITIRISDKKDRNEIVRQNVLFFDDIPETEEPSDKEATRNEDGTAQIEALLNTETVPLIDDTPNSFTYMVELSGLTIGKIRVEYGDNYAFICGFGILPDYRGKGYGKAALKETLHLLQEKNIAEVELDVLCTNSNALNLYKACGFEEISIMNYYQYPLVGCN